MVYRHTKTTARYNTSFCLSYIFFAFSSFLFEPFNTGLIDIENVKEIVRFLIKGAKFRVQWSNDKLFATMTTKTNVRDSAWYEVP